MPHSSTFTVSIQPERSALLAGHPQTIHALVRIQAPAAPAANQQRQPLNLALVIDRSGSMSGTPLREARRCVQMILRSLQPTDSVAVVAFDDEVTVNIPHQVVGTQAEKLCHVVDTIHSGGSTALYDGWHAGVGQALQGPKGTALSRVLLLSDGGANRGLADPEEIANRVAAMAQAGISTSTYGLGSGFNEHLMIGMGRAGRGNHYYGATAEDLEDPFREEFDLLRALHARGLRLHLQAPEGVKVEVLNGYAQDPDRGAYCLPDLPYGGEAWALVKLTVPIAMVPAVEAAPSMLLEATVTAVDLESQPLAPQSGWLSLASLPATAHGVLVEDELVAARRSELRAADLQERAQAAARNRDWRLVDKLLAEALREAENNPWLKGVVESLQRYAAMRQEEAMAKEAMYSSQRMRSRVTAQNEQSSVYSSNEEAEQALFLRRKMEQGKRMPPQPTPGATPKPTPKP
jgi:Ca-activated chloride channel family protein